ncbi:tektin-4-like [Microplitis demolitor]|uniref:tektin-4-like n=1 Tax=Microplitis demolitor TaxID=69319 RepID=UPI0006D51E36|nr:tektin-4-like [Microplitis demolitor]
MLNRQYLDLRCSSNDPGRVRDERSRIDERPTAENLTPSPKIEPCGIENFNYKPEAGDCPTVDALRERTADDGKPPAYFPQPDDNIPAIDEGPMGPVGPWATGRPVFSPRSGMTGLRPVVDRYSMTRYTPAQWRSHNQTFFDQSSRMINNARTLAKNVREHNKIIYRETDKNQLENRDRLSGRAGEIHHWKTELERALIELTDEIELLETEHRRVKQSLSVLTIPESIAGEFLQIRSTRMEPDLVRDKVEDELVKEVALCAVVRDVLNKTRESIEDELSELKAVKTRLEFDLTDKVDAYANDSTCVGFTNDSPLIMMKPGATRVPPEQSSPEGYDNFTKENLITCENIRQKSTSLRATLNDTYLRVVRDLRQQATQVDLALTENVNVTEQVCQALEKELVNCLNQLSDTEKLIEELRGANRGLKDAMKVAQTRLSIRLERRNVENCRDIPQYGLIEEVKTIGENLTSMADQLRQAEETQAGLVKSRGDLEREIMVKRKTLYIDRDRGQLLRSFYPSAEALSGHV